MWIKNRDTTNIHSLFDTLRGPGKLLATNSSDAEEDRGSTALISFDEKGFSVSNDNVTGSNNQHFSAWSWDAGSADPTTDTWNGATLPTYYKANVSKGFSVCTYTGGGGNNSYGHGLGTAPDFVLVKRLDFGTSDWATYHSSINNMKGGALAINTTGQFEVAPNQQWNNNVDFDDVACYLAANVPPTNERDVNYVAYNWVETAGVSKFGTYTGQSGNPFFIECGFKPALVIIKRYNSAGGNWVMISPSGNYVYANLNNGVADSGTQLVEFNENGFTVKGSNSDINSGGQHLYCAWSSTGVVATVLEDADVANKSMIVDGGDWDTSNQSQIWSKQIVGEAYPTDLNVGPFTRLFDGNYDTYTAANADTSCSWTAPANSTYEIYFGKDATAAPLKINGVDYNGSSPATGSNLSTVEWSTSDSLQWVKVAAIKLDGKLLVDAALDSQEWSAEGTITNADPNLPVSNAFDGSITTQWFPVASSVSTYTFPSIVSGSKFELYVETSGGNTNFSVNGELPSGVPANLSASWIDVTDAVVASGLGGLSYIDLGYTPGAYAQSIYAIKVDDKFMLDKSIRDLGETTAKVLKAGTGVVSSVNLEFNTMTLSTTNNEWVDGYYASTSEKNAVEMRGYLSFDSQGNNVDLERLPQSPVLMDDKKTPKLNFPSTFSTGEGVDTDLPFPTYLETYVQASNDLGSSLRVKSNELFPNWTGRPYIAPGSYRVMQDEFADWCYWACSSDYRAAVKTIQDAEATVQELRTKAAEPWLQNFLDRDDVY